MKTINLKFSLVILAFATFFTSCKKSTDTDNGSTSVTELTLKDVAYSTNAKQNMDVYLPANRSTANTYILIMVHGGAWSDGDKTDFNVDIPSIKPLLGNYAIFNINYRLANGSSVVVQQQLDDINTAFDFITSHAAEYKVNTSKIALMGASAGAHLALLKAYKSNADGRIKAMVDLFGPSDMAWMYNNHPVPTITQPIIAAAVGGTPTTNAAAYTSAGPINFVAATAPPTIIFHGTADPVVPISESDRLNTKLQTMGVTHTYVTYTGESHGWTGTNLTDTYNKSVAFIKQYVQ
jgi:acetyl esterase/lipase